MNKKGDYIVKFNSLVEQGKLLDNYERIVNNFLVFYYCLIIFQGWLPDNKVKETKNSPSYNNYKLYANEGALATLQKEFVKKALEESKNNEENYDFEDKDENEDEEFDESELAYYPDEGTIQYKGKVYGVKGLTSFIQIIYTDLRKEFIKPEYLKYFRVNKTIPKKLLDTVLNYLNEKIEKNIFF